MSSTPQVPDLRPVEEDELLGGPEEDLGLGGRWLTPEAFDLVLVEAALSDARRALRRAGARPTSLRREILTLEGLLQELWLRAVTEGSR